ncbi:hypothetical protein [Amycolatopsis sp. CA-230715]|uniref:hypothetical protein n=1 Tax=Amycolatopsis sp. CA-230715 TaxID=2745196 RepID=UPI001C019896|nr:hypothetical protein [Amycolatopsis sp. CA-230715]QWF82258.1 hypothetical protein HUW46_05695 [Amycolatopsis sp. CA-230715]
MRKTALFVGGVAMTVALGACGNPAAPDPGLQKAFTDAKSLGEASSAAIAKGQSVKFSFEVTGDPKNTGKGHGESRTAETDPATSVVLEGGDAAAEFRLFTQAIYMRLPEQGRTPGMAKPWAKFALDDSSSPAALFTPMFKQLADNTTPAKIIERLRDAGTVTGSDQAQLDGTATTHYKLELDGAKVLDKQIATMPEQLRAAYTDEAKKRIQALNLKLPMELWLDSEQRPVKLFMDAGDALEKAAKQHNVPADGPKPMITVRYTDWGGPVDITPPAPDQVAELPKS